MQTISAPVDLGHGKCGLVRAKDLGDFRVKKKLQIGAEGSLNAAKLFRRLVEIVAKCGDQFHGALVAFIHQFFNRGGGILLIEQKAMNVRDGDIRLHVPENFKGGLDGELSVGREKRILPASSGQ